MNQNVEVMTSSSDMDWVTPQETDLRAAEGERQMSSGGERQVIDPIEDLEAFDAEVRALAVQALRSFAEVELIVWDACARLQEIEDAKLLVASIDGATRRLTARWWDARHDYETARMIDLEVARLMGQGYGTVRRLCDIDAESHRRYRRLYRAWNAGWRSLLVCLPHTYSKTMCNILEER